MKIGKVTQLGTGRMRINEKLGKEYYGNNKKIWKINVRKVKKVALYM